MGYLLKLKKYRQYKRICRKLDHDINIWVVSMQWDLARNTSLRLQRVKKIWEGKK